MDAATTRFREQQVRKRADAVLAALAPGARAVPLDPGLATAIAGIVRDAIAGSPDAADVVLEFAEGLLHQRTDGVFGGRLRFADHQVMAVVDLGRAVFGVGPAAGYPVVWMEGSGSPCVYRARDELWVQGRLNGGASVIPPLPLVVVPRALIDCPWLLGPLHHEVAHVLDDTLGVTESLLATRIEATPGWAALVADKRADGRWAAAWAQWAGELAADVLGTLLGGEGIAWAFDPAAPTPVDPPGGSEVHPPDALRIAVLHGIVAALDAGFELPPLPAEAAGPVSPAFGQVEVAVAWLLDAPQRALGGEGLRSLLPTLRERARALAAVGETLDADAAVAPTVAAADWWRLYPAAARRRLEHVLDLPDRLALRCLAMPAPGWVPAAAVAADPEATATAGFKRMPDHFARWSEMAFVGYTHDRLLPKLEAAFVAREQRKWARIEVFFLDPARLGAVASARATGAELVRLAAETEAALATRLPDLATSWAISRYADPFLCAGYYDAGRRGGLVHVSAQIWGADIRECPGWDYRWVSSAPPPGYLAYARGLEALRERAAPVATGAPLATPAPAPSRPPE